VLFEVRRKKQDTIDNLQAEISSKDSLIKDLKETIAHLEKKIDSLESERNDLKSQLSEKGQHTCFGADIFQDDNKAIR
jgi:chromosome segregation ATPase